MSTPYLLWRSIKAAIDKEIDAEKDRLGEGRWYSESDGKVVVGKIRGLKTAKRLARAELEKLEKLEEDEDD